MSLMKEIQTGSGFRQCSRTVPVGEVNFLPQQRQRHLETPAAVDPVLPGAPGAALRTPRVRLVGRGGLGECAHADLLATPPPVYGFPERQELVGGVARHERPEGDRSSHMDLPHLLERPPGGIVATQRSGWAFGQILRLVGKSMAFGAFRSPNHHLLSKLLESVIKQMRCLRQCVFAKMHS